MSMLGPEVIKGNVRLVETEKLADCSKNAVKPTAPSNYTALVGHLAWAAHPLKCVPYALQQTVKILYSGVCLFVCF